MMEPGPQQLGKWLVLAGVVMALIGSIIMLLSRIGVFRLPGDLQFGSRNWRLYLPITSCILLSIILTLIVWLIGHFRR